MYPANHHVARIIILTISCLISNNSQALESTPSLATQRMELETETRMLKASTAQEQRRIEELKKLIDTLSKNNATLDKQLEQSLNELKDAVESTADQTPPKQQ